MFIPRSPFLINQSALAYDDRVYARCDALDVSCCLCGGIGDRAETEEGDCTRDAGDDVSDREFAWHADFD